MKSTALAILSLAFALSAAPEAAATTFKPPPLPGDISIMEASPKVPAAAKALVGRWEGILFGGGDQVPHTFIVERLEPRLAWTVWSIGETMVAIPGWYRLNAALTSDGFLKMRVNRANVTYTLGPDGTLLCEIDIVGFKTRGILKRVAASAVPFDEEVIPWLNLRANARPLPSTSPVPAVLPDDLQFETPDSTVGAGRSKWAGKFGGSACNGGACEIKLAVLRIEGDEADVVQLFASATANPNPKVRRAVFIGEDLHIRAGKLHVAYRMDADGIVSMYRRAPNGTTAWGLLAREP